MTDAEIIKACAEHLAPGADFIWSDHANGWVVCEPHARCPEVINPLTDRAQALELAEKLRLDICDLDGEVWDVTKEDACGMDKNLLRAICLCAARVRAAREFGLEAQEFECSNEVYPNIDRSPNDWWRSSATTAARQALALPYALSDSALQTLSRSDDDVIGLVREVHEKATEHGRKG